MSTKEATRKQGGKKDGTYVADADAADLARGEERLHLLPRVGVLPVPDDVALAVGERRELVVVACNLQSAFHTTMIL